mmetsp:Transcript_21406/g.24872  ORF Transcript_21406/g.24872 Transcript_21406/m.24872 type:complete len:305 (-) Transcript_21406:6-920(-)
MKSRTVVGPPIRLVFSQRALVTKPCGCGNVRTDPKSRMRKLSTVQQATTWSSNAVVCCLDIHRTSRVSTGYRESYRRLESFPCSHAAMTARLSCGRRVLVVKTIGFALKRYLMDLLAQYGRLPSALFALSRSNRNPIQSHGQRLFLQQREALCVSGALILMVSSSPLGMSRCPLEIPYFLWTGILQVSSWQLAAEITASRCFASIMKTHTNCLLSSPKKTAPRYINGNNSGGFARLTAPTSIVFASHLPRLRSLPQQSRHTNIFMDGLLHAEMMTWFGYGSCILGQHQPLRQLRSSVPPILTTF